MMTFLEFVVTELLGLPGDDGSWICPYCSIPEQGACYSTFKVSPPKGALDVKWRCFSGLHHDLGFREWGDEFDLIRHVHRCGYLAAKVIVAELWERYRREVSSPPIPERKKITSQAAAKKLAASFLQRKEGKSR